MSASKKRIVNALIVVLAMLVAVAFIATQPVSAASKPYKVKGVKVVTKYAARNVKLADGTEGYISPVKIKWNKSRNAKKYQVAFRQSNTKTWRYLKTANKNYKIQNLDSRAYNLKPGTKYYIKVRGINGKKYGKWSKTKAVTTLPMPELQPGKVTNVRVPERYDTLAVKGYVGNAAPIKVAWDAVANAKTYEVALTNGKEGWITMTTSDTSVKVLDEENPANNLRTYCKYTIKVRAINGKTYGEWSDEITTYTKPNSFDIDFPDMTNALSLKAGLGSMKLTWTVEEPGEDSMVDYSRIKYNVYGSTDGENWDLITQLPATAREYIQRYCEPGIEYFFKVVPVDNESYKTFEVEGTASNVESAKVKDSGVTIEKHYTENNDSNLWNRSYNLRGLMIHSTVGGIQDAETWVNMYNNEMKHDVAVHGFIDGGTGVFWQTQDFDIRSGHAGAAGNDRYVGVEICESQYVTYPAGEKIESDDPALNGAPKIVMVEGHEEDAKESAELTYGTAVDLFAFLCDYYGFNPNKKGVVISHTEWERQYMEYQNGLFNPEHYWYQVGTGYTMTTFRTAIAEKLSANGN